MLDYRELSLKLLQQGRYRRDKRSIKDLLITYPQLEKGSSILTHYVQDAIKNNYHFCGAISLWLRHSYLFSEDDVKVLTDIAQNYLQTWI